MVFVFGQIKNKPTTNAVGLLGAIKIPFLKSYGNFSF